MSNLNNLETIQNIFKVLADTHGLSSEWSFGFDNAKRRAGVTKSKTKRITLSTNFIKIAKMPEIINTLLHEIAHALVGCNHMHNDIWKTKAIEIGCDGNRCCSNEISTKIKESTPPPWRLRCPCGINNVERHRRTEKMTRKICRKCKENLYFIQNVF